jgi:hypothetical protein
MTKEVGSFAHFKMTTNNLYHLIWQVALQTIKLLMLKSAVTTSKTLCIREDALNEIQPHDIIHIITEEIVLERECEPFLIGENYYKAISIVLPNNDDDLGEKQTFTLGTLNVRQLRKVAGSLGVRNSSRMLKDTNIITIGQLSKIGGVVNDATASLQPEGGAGLKQNVRYFQENVHVPTPNVITQSFD